ncbi:type II toxin-antitoxin system VapC family toxin [Thermogemmatispora carboxidivorans]|uniref:type II toxin-antitoxin system VapC family toxin n=1 Tax=Thermogemmatispora carboxidivorans TaxID=1382306 RepID=UPI0009DD5BC8|nr:type II toxin-antitoxin system VapC family toxin [Thermogemmatispora carboxidivorans]
MSKVVLDASALMALLRREPGNDKVQSALAGAAISAVSFSEVLVKAAEVPKGFEAAKALLRGLQLPIIAFDEQQAELAAGLRPITRSLGLSLGDRCCLALALTRALPVMTADRGWAELQIGVNILVIC